MVDTVKPPRRYLKKYCKQADEVLTGGYPFSELCRQIGISVKVGRRWALKHTEFGESIDKATTAGHAMWMKRIMGRSLGAKSFTLDGKEVVMNLQWLTLFMRNTYTGFSTTDSEARLQSRIDELEAMVDSIEQDMKK